MSSHNRTLDSLAGAKAGIIVNFLLVILKGAAGIFAGSFAMLADALHSAADIVASAVVYVGISVASKPADADHPYGHGKAESIASKIVSILVILAGLNSGYFSLRALFTVPESPPGMAALWAALISILVKEWLFRYTYNIGATHGNKALVANAYDHRGDALSSVAALIGIGGARLGTNLGIAQFAYLDALAGVVVSVFIVRMGYLLAKEAASELMDSQAGSDLSAELKKLTLETDGVWELHSIRTRAAGPHLLVDMVIGVAENITVREGHDVAKRVKDKLLAEKSEIEDVLIHVNPCKECSEKRDLTQF